MTAAHLRGLLKPVGRQANDRLCEDVILETLQMEESARSLAAMCDITATIYGGAPLKAEARKKIFSELMDKSGDARLLASFAFHEYKSRTSELAPEQVYAAMVAAGVLKEKKENA